MGIATRSCQMAIYDRIPSYPRASLPLYAITLDESASNPNPGPGEKQRFCYRIVYNGDGEQSFAPLDYVVLGVSSEMTEADFSSLTVAINGANQSISWGVNAGLIPASSPDSGTGCPGLRLAFALTGSTDEMTICFGLNRTFPVGMINVCFFEGNSASVAQVAGPITAQEEGDCPTTTYQEVDVCVPVTIAPYATVGDAVVTCCGSPTITPGAEACGGVVGGTCSFTISQRVCVAVPVTFGADAAVGDYTVNCGVPGEGGCENCAAGTMTTAAGRQGSIGCGCRGEKTISTVSSQTRIQDVIGGAHRGCTAYKTIG